MLGVGGNSLMPVVAVSIVELLTKRVAKCVSIREGTVGEGELRHQEKVKSLMGLMRWLKIL